MVSVDKKRVKFLLCRPDMKIYGSLMCNSSVDASRSKMEWNGIWSEDAADSQAQNSPRRSEIMM